MLENDPLFDYLIATDQLDDFLGNTESENVDDDVENADDDNLEEDN